MPSVRAIASSLFGFALLTVSTAQNDGWIKYEVTESDRQMLYSALKDVNSYSPGITTLACVKTVLGLEKQGEGAGSVGGDGSTPPVNPNAGKDTLSHFSVDGCEVDAQRDLGQCPASVNCDQTSFDIYLTQPTGTNQIKVTSVKANN
ncbi:protease inhibitor EpiC2B [Phytophthora palmivora]|uniref:Protease inhibitor EpiC2B n=1 Tax=Phytophthora palmivora TaxID=4796 RepID=A0A2P4YA11_9STRA|nr:protease inhibitor EpiC2B [Phytophthora palmivora]